MSVIEEGIATFQVGDKAMFQGRVWQVKECYRNQALLVASYTKHRARKGGRPTLGRTFTLQHYSKLEKVNGD